MEDTPQDMDSLETTAYKYRLQEILDIIRLSEKINTTRSRIARAAIKAGIKELKTLSIAELKDRVRE